MHVVFLIILINVDYLDLLKFPFSVIGITETWITNDCDLSFYNIDDYKFLSCCRNDRQGGGVGLYLKDNVNLNRLTDLEINDDKVCQSIFVEIKFNKSSTIIGAIYRPPNGDIEKFNDYVVNALGGLGGSNKSIHISQLKQRQKQRMKQLHNIGESTMKHEKKNLEK